MKTLPLPMTIGASPVATARVGLTPEQRAIVEADDGPAVVIEAIGRSASFAADEARAQGPDPLTFRTIALDTAAGANLLDVAPLPGHFSYSSLSTYEACPLQYAFSYVYGIPTARKVGALTFGSTAHAAFEAFTRERRERAARGDPEPTRADLARLFAAAWTPTAFPDRTTEDGFKRRIVGLLDNFYDGELVSRSQVLHEELDFDLVLAPGDGSAPIGIHGQIDRIDRLPGGGIEVIDYKTGRISSQKGVDESLQALHLRARLPGCAGSRHAGAGDAVLHGERHAVEHSADGRAAGRGAGGHPGEGQKGPCRQVCSDAGGCVPVL